MSRKAIAWGPVILWALGLFLLSEIQGTPDAFQPFLAISDKVVHFVLYLALGGLLARARWVGGTEGWHGAFLLVGLLYAAIDEWHQSFVPGRTPEPADWLADAAGVAVGYVFLTVARSRRAFGTPEAEER